MSADCLDPLGQLNAIKKSNKHKIAAILQGPELPSAGLEAQALVRSQILQIQYLGAQKCGVHRHCALPPSIIKIN